MDSFQNHVAVTSKEYLNVIQQKAMDKEATKQIKKNERKEREKKSKKNIYNIEYNKKVGWNWTYKTTASQFHCSGMFNENMKKVAN